MKHIHLHKHFTSAKLFQLVALSSVIVLLGAAAALLLPGNLRLDSHASRAMPADLSIVGPPSLPAATVDTIFARTGSPMQGTGKVIETASRQNNIDDAFALAVWYTETNDGLTGVGLSYHNPGGVRGSVGYPSGGGGYTIYPSYAAAASYWFQMMRSVYVARGMTTVYSLAHIYVGTSSSGIWAGKVIALMECYHGEAPPPTPSPIATAIPSPVTPHQKVISAITSRSSASATSQQASGPTETTMRPRIYPTNTPGNTVSHPDALELIVTCFALLLALGIFLWARKIEPEPASRISHRPAPAIQTFSPLQAPVMLQAEPVTGAFAPAWQFSLTGSFFERGNATGELNFVASSLRAGDRHQAPTPHLTTPCPYASQGPQTDALARPAMPLRVPQSVALPALPASSQTNSGSGQMAYGGRLRRTVLLPSWQTAQEGNTPLPLTGGERPAGLLSRYGKMPQEEGPFIGQ